MSLRDSVLEQFQTIALEHAPNEAVGILVDERIIIPLPNHSDSPKNSFELKKSDIIEALRTIELETYELVIWHTHPSGGVGPSRVDLQNRVDGVTHLVLTLVDEEIVPTWY